MPQSVDQRARRMPGARVHHHSSRFVQDGDVFILIQDVERDRLCSQRRRLGWRNLHFDVIAPVDDGVRFQGDGPANANASLCNQPLEL